VSTERQVVLPDDAGDQYKSVPAWMELPQVTNASAWHAHTTILRFDRVRNYSFSYNPEAHVANWVAYPLYEEFSRNKKKTKVPRYDSVVSTNQAWACDPFVTTSNVDSGDYYEWSTKGYSRGHQLPSADRLGGAMANIQTFYTSNVTPQNIDFNGGIWENLETAVRNWASDSDTLYVVTGCIADNTCETVKDHDGQAVSVPKAYYKALLSLKGGKYIGAGFYLEHSKSIASGDYKNYSLSLKDLEAKTGMNFFVNLPADKAAAIKADDPSKIWK
jgi:endonuclease G